MTQRKLIRELTEHTTAQKLFDYISAFLVRQKVQSIKNGNCLYRGPRGLMCAVGCIIPDSVYRPTFEGLTVDDLLYDGLRLPDKEESKQFWMILDNHRELLVRLQLVHDGGTPGAPSDKPPIFEEGLKEVAKDFGLNFDPMLYKQL